VPAIKALKKHASFAGMVLPAKQAQPEWPCP
jgi:hypothetical protein